MFHPCRHFGDPLSRRFTKFRRCNLAKSLPSALLPPSCRENKTIPVRLELALDKWRMFLGNSFLLSPSADNNSPFHEVTYGSLYVMDRAMLELNVDGGNKTGCGWRGTKTES
ncbi:hypothetical protein CEXT_510731 [Caerostris extrusa]|uniref:Uncharacterized protein n=1 Tax=Caerostris extrusa TaxID=172846 RepID=A0AAV4WMZ8_CAEEX|nr:hypothetical protein CEXT_510731 [Caerostris extrusa]